MGAVRHRELIRVLSCVVVLDMVVGVVALAARSGDRPERVTQFAGSTGIPLDTKNGSVLAGGNFDNRRTSGAGGSATTLATGPPADTPAPSVTTATRADGAVVKNGSKMGDPAGDALVDGTQAPIKEGRADIVRTRAVYKHDRVTFAVQVDQPSDPLKDERWASDSTFASWAVDTKGDGDADFEIQYYIDEGTFEGVVSKPGAAEPEIVCEVGTADVGPEGYSVTVPASCLGEPASIRYRVTMFYDTDPTDENADVATDVAPNGGFSKPISRGA